MYQVFSVAFLVLIWLGLADEDSEYALALLKGLKLLPRQDIPRVTKIFERPWASRMWSFQEGLAANSTSPVLCGSTTVPWKTNVASSERPS